MPSASIQTPQAHVMKATGFFSIEAYGTLIMMEQTENTNVLAQENLITPDALKTALPVSEPASHAVADARRSIRKILRGNDSRLMVIVGPCSIHDPDAALEYARELAMLARELQDTLFIVMRAYFEKPRTTTGWKGLINDPALDGTFHIEEGIRIARELLLKISHPEEFGLPIATEALDPIMPQYLQDLIAWSAIGARTVESQTHREMASGLSCPVGFKNSTDGSLAVAINGLRSVSTPHRFLGINQRGEVAIIHTRGNSDGHLVLRGGDAGPNFDAASIADATQQMRRTGLAPAIVVDCSHANSCKDHRRQPLVADDVAAQIEAGNRSIVGIMLESNLKAGNQALADGKHTLEYGVSITDACIDWASTEQLLRGLAARLRDPLTRRLDTSMERQVA